MKDSSKQFVDQELVVIQNILLEPREGIQYPQQGQFDIGI